MSQMSQPSLQEPSAAASSWLQHPHSPGGCSVPDGEKIKTNTRHHDTQSLPVSCTGPGLRERPARDRTHLCPFPRPGLQGEASTGQ